MLACSVHATWIKGEVSCWHTLGPEWSPRCDGASLGGPGQWQPGSLWTDGGCQQGKGGSVKMTELFTLKILKCMAGV